MERGLRCCGCGRDSVLHTFPVTLQSPQAHERCDMIRAQRLMAVTLGLAMVTVACHKKAQVTPVPVATASNRPTETCDKRCQDSIAASDARRRAHDDSVAKANADRDARNRSRAAAMAALTAKVYFEYDQADLSGDARSTL